MAPPKRLVSFPRRGDGPATPNAVSGREVIHFSSGQRAHAGITVYLTIATAWEMTPVRAAVPDLNTPAIVAN
jgi:hypothetical protein